MAKRILIILLCVLYLGVMYVLFVDTSLLDVFNKNQPTIEQPDGSPGTVEPEETPGTEEPGEEKPVVEIVDNNKQFTVDFNNLNSENLYSINLNVCEYYTFNLVGINSSDYNLKVVNCLPTSDYNFTYFASANAFYNVGFKSLSEVEDYGKDNKMFWSWSAGEYDYSKGFTIEENSNNFKFAMVYDSLDLFLDNFFNEDVEVFDMGTSSVDGSCSENMLEDFLEVYAFKLKVTKQSTNEVISFLLNFKK